MKIWKAYSKKLKRDEWRSRFELNGKTFRPKAETKDKLQSLVREIHSQEAIEQNNKKYNLNLEVVSSIPTVAEIFEKALPKVQKPHQKKIAERVFETFLNLLPPIKVSELRTSHFQIYINYRRSQLGVQTKQPVKLTTVYKELYAITGALNLTAPEYDALESWQTPELPALPKGYKKKQRRERLVSDRELKSVIDELLKEPKGRQLHTRFHRVRLAHQIEFGYWTGLRRKEIARLKFSQYDESQQALLNVRRWKTDTVTKFFPLGVRAVEIIMMRRELQKDSDFIFTPDGQPVESNYRTLKEICEHLKIPYGRFTDGGFVAHDLRHNFGTEILRESDIETARELLGHSNISQTSTYVHTSADRLREAVRKRDKIDYDGELERIFEAVKKGEFDGAEFAEKIKKIFGF